MDAHPNFAVSTVATAPSPATSGTSLVVQAGDGARFASFPFNATVWPAGQIPTVANAEIVRITGRSTDTLTITRTQESTSARTIVVGDYIAVTDTQKIFTDIEADVSAATTQAALQAAQIETRRIADLGQYVLSTAGLALTANASTVTGITRTSGNNTLDKTAHGLVANDTIILTGITNTTGITNGTTYFVSATGLVANSFRVATSAGGTALTLSGTTDTATITASQIGKLDMAAGTAFMGTTEFTVAAQTAISTTIASMADATNPKWVSVELDSGATVDFVQGTAAATPVFPTITATRTPLGFLYIPAAATTVDALTTTLNGNAKLFDARNVRTYHPSRRIATDAAGTLLTNQTASLASVLTAPVTLPANSLSVDDVYEIAGTIRYLNSQNASTVEIKATFGAATLFDWTSASLGSSATARAIPFKALVTVVSGGIDQGGFIIAGAASASTGTNADNFEFQTVTVLTIASAQTIDLQCKVTTTSSTSTFSLRGFTILKHPA